MRRHRKGLSRACTARPTTDLVIHLEGGLIQAVYASRPESIGLVIVRDYDIDGSEAELARDGQLYCIGSAMAGEIEIGIAGAIEDLESQPFMLLVHPNEL